MKFTTKLKTIFKDKKLYISLHNSEEQTENINEKNLKVSFYIARSLIPIKEACCNIPEGKYEIIYNFIM